MHRPSTIEIPTPTNHTDEEDLNIINEMAEIAKRARTPRRGQEASSSINSEVRPTQNPDQNPDDEIVPYKLREAKRFYKGTLPAFTIRADKGTPIGSTKDVVIGSTWTETESKIKAQLILQEWDSRNGFWTLDYNDKRYIVKYVQGGKDGSGYRVWLGAEKGYREVVTAPIAFVDKIPAKKEKRRLSTTSEDLFDSEMGESDEDIQTQKKSSCKSSIKEGVEMKYGLRAKEPFKPYTSYKAAQATGGRSEAQKKGNPQSEAEIRRPRLPKPQRSSTNDPQSVTPSPSRDNFTISTRNNSTTELGASPSPDGSGISAKKRTKTTFNISINTKSDRAPVPVYLDSCPKVEDFFTQLLSAWDINDKASIEAVDVKFSWLKNGARMTVREHMPDTWRKLLERVEQAPCWKAKGNGECEVEVEIVMKELKD